MSTQTDVIATRDEAARVGEQIYRRLRVLLEPNHIGKVVAIHIPSENYFLGDTLFEASDLLHNKYPHASRGEVYARGVGDRALMHARTPRATRAPQ